MNQTCVICVKSSLPRSKCCGGCNQLFNQTVCISCCQSPKNNPHQFCSIECANQFNCIQCKREKKNHPHQFCSIECANQFNCIQCKREKKNHPHQFCSIECANQFNCIQCKREKKNHPHQFCSIECANEFNCIKCKRKKKNHPHQFCSIECAKESQSIDSDPFVQKERTNTKNVKFMDLQTTNKVQYYIIEKQFTKKWSHSNKPKPKLISILQIIPPPSIQESHEKYKQTIINKRPNLKLYKYATQGNTLRRFHGTTLVFLYFFISFSFS